MSRPALAVAMAHEQEFGRVRVEATFSCPVLCAEHTEEAGPLIRIDEGVTTLELRFVCLEDLLAFQHNLSHLAIPRGLSR